MQCRIDCGACCIAPLHIQTQFTACLRGNPQMIRCVQLSNDNLCNIFGSELRQKVCGNLQPSLRYVFNGS